MNTYFFAILLLTISAYGFADTSKEGGKLEISDEPHMNVDFPLALIIRPIQDKVHAFKGNDQYHAVYELLVTNATSTPFRIKAINITGKKCELLLASHEKRQENALKSLHSDLSLSSINADFLKKCPTVYSLVINNEELRKSFSSLVTKNALAPQDPLLKSNETGVFYLFLNFSSLDQVPDVIENRLGVEIEGKPESLKSYSSNAIIIDKSSPIVLHPPLEGENWFAADGPSNLSGHRRSIVVLDGNPNIAQRFAIDFIQYGPNHEIFTGSSSENKNFYAYGQKVLAVADGVIFSSNDGIPENTPGEFPSVTTLKNVAGNFIILKTDSNHYAFYAHLIPGSLLVKEGDRVTVGQLLGKLGNSGNSIAPHLHFHVSTEPLPVDGFFDKPHALNAQGIPWVLNEFIKEDFDLDAKEKGKGDVAVPEKVLQTGKNQRIEKGIIMDRDLVNFPPSSK